MGVRFLSIREEIYKYRKDKGYKESWCVGLELEVLVWTHDIDVDTGIDTDTEMEIYLCVFTWIYIYRWIHKERIYRGTHINRHKCVCVCVLVCEHVLFISLFYPLREPRGYDRLVAVSMLGAQILFLNVILH